LADSPTVLIEGSTVELTAIQDQDDESMDLPGPDYRLFMNVTNPLQPANTDPEQTNTWQATGDTTAGAEETSSGGDDRFTGVISRIRIWAGAMMDEDQIACEINEQGCT
jgi:hypothetical protein